MESIIAQQKIARRRPLVGIRSEARRSSAGSRRGLGRGRSLDADFFLLEGGTGRSYEAPLALKSRSPRHSAGAQAPNPGALGFLATRERPKKRFSLRDSRAFHPGKPFAALVSKLGSALVSAFGSLPIPSLAPFRGRIGAPGRPFSSEMPREEPAARKEGAAPSESRGAPSPLARALLPASFGALALACLVLGFGALRQPAFPLPAAGLLPEGSAEDVLLAYLSPELAEPAEVAEIPPPPQSLEIERYTVRPGDSLGAIAARAGVSMDSLVSMNGITSARGLRAGTELKIPNMDGLVHLVRKGESLGSIARKYKAELPSLADANDLGTAVIRPGQSLFIPGARLPPAEIKRVLGELTIWPLRGRISSYYGYRADPFTGVRRFHAGLDIVAPSGASIAAAMDGRVADLGYNAVFGNYLILNHADGMQTLYGHLSAFAVKRGQSVAQGQRLGSVGSTGYSTGPHLHFSLYRGGSPVNPLKYLK